MKFKNVLYMFLMVIFMVLAYLFVNSGINAKTKIYVNYKCNSDVIYKVYLHDSSKPLSMNSRYTTSLVDRINLDFTFDSMFSTNVSGYYKYNINGYLVAYTEDINDALLRKKYILLSDIINPLNTNEKYINIEQDIDIFYNKYIEELKKIANEYDMDVNGYLEIEFNVSESLNFSEMDEIKELEKQVKLIIPLSYDTFRINVINDKKDLDSFYDFSRKQPVNYFLMLFGAFCLSLGISFLVLVIRNMIISYKEENKFNKEFKKILKLHSDKVVSVKRFYNKKKYNLIYVSTFDELMGVYNKVKKSISYKLVKRGSKAIFLLIDDDNAWIYRMCKEDL